MTPATRARPTLTSADLNRRPNGSRIDGSEAPVPTGAPMRGPAVSTVSGARPRTTYAAFQRSQAAAATPATRAPVSPQPSFAGLEGFARENAMANANVYQPGTVAATNAVVNRTGSVYNPPQQTERANPLTGDNNIPPEGATTNLARVPFVQRGASIPSGQDALPAPVRETMSEDADIGASMDGTQARLRGTGPSPFARRFSGSPTKQSAYDSFLKRIGT